jgi:acyl carrier protein
MRLSDTQIMDGVAEVARRHLGWNDELRPEMRLVEDLELDSLKTLTLALEIENHFRICLDEEAGIQTVGDLVAIIRGLLDE